MSNFQPSLKIRARLTSFIFLKPKLPRTLGVQMEFQDLRERFLVFEAGNPLPEVFKDLVKLAANAVWKKEGAQGIGHRRE